MICFSWSWNLNQRFHKKVLICTNLKNVWVQIFLHYQKNFWEQTIDLGDSTKCYNNFENFCCKKDIVQISHIYRTILFDLPSVSIIFVLGNSLTKTSFEAKVIRPNWKLKKMLLFSTFWLYVQTMSSYYNSTAFYKKLTSTDLSCQGDQQFLKWKFKNNSRTFQDHINTF